MKYMKYMYSKTISKTLFFGGGGGGGRGVGAYLRLGAYKIFLPIGWAIIRGWALNRINTVCLKPLPSF